MMGHSETPSWAPGQPGAPSSTQPTLTPYGQMEGRATVRIAATDTATTTTETWTAWFDDGTARRWQTVYTAAVADS